MCVAQEEDELMMVSQEEISFTSLQSQKESKMSTVMLDGVAIVSMYAKEPQCACRVRVCRFKYSIEFT